jgi:protocatechuate 3,4-dioxygenase beta subunit
MRARFGYRKRSVVRAGVIVFTALIFLTGCNRQAAANKIEGLDQWPHQWNVKIVSDQEAGEPLIVSGTIYSPDGKQPLPGITLYVYQTDATGRYSTSGGDNRATRIHGVMRTNAEGRYEFRTIKPGSYPNSRNPAHIHAYISGPEYPEYWIDEFLFADDPFIKDDDRQKAIGQRTFAHILSLTRGSDGILRAVRDIKIERCTKNCTGRT